jgi:uncharacterized membrane protein
MIGGFKGSSRLRNEIGEWVEQGIISHEQARILRERYELERETPWYLRSGFIIRALALLLGGMGLFLLISQNWSEFSLVARAATGIVPLALAYGFGLYYRFTEDLEKSELAFFFASLAFGANIFLQAQIFHISAYYPEGIMWWAIGALPLAIYFMSSLHNGLLNAIYFFWLTQQISYNQFSWMSPVFLCGILYILWYRPNKTVLFMTMVNLYLFLFNINDGLRERYFAEFWLLLYAITLMLLVLLPLLRERYDDSFLTRLARILHFVLLVTLFINTFEGVVGTVIESGTLAPVSYAVFAVALLGFLLQPRTPFITASLLLTAPLLVIHIVSLFPVPSAVVASHYLAIGINIVLFAYAVWRIRYGLQQRRKHEFMSGILIIVALAISRYFDYFDSYIVMSGVFLGCGVLLLVVNNYWNRAVLTEPSEENV